MLGVLAVVPLTGLALFALGRILAVQDTNRELGELDQATSQLVQLVELEASLQRESFWSKTAFSLMQMDISPTLVAVALGVDPRDEHDDAQRVTDLVATSAALPDLIEAVSEARAQEPDLDNGVQPLDVVSERIVESAIEQKANEVISLAADQPNGADLVRYARTLELANQLRSDYSDMRATFFANFATLDHHAEHELGRRLAIDRASYEERLDDLSVLVADQPAVSEEFAALLEDQDRLALINEVASLLLDFEAGSTDILDVANQPSQLGPVAANLATAESASARHLTFVSHTAAALQADVNRVHHDAIRSGWLVAGLAVGMAAATFGAIVATTRWIVRPLANLGKTASAITEGGHGSLPTPSGPVEIRQIHEALSEAISNLERTEQQAIALADGALDDPSLSQPVPGRFGATLHAAIEQLRHSISHQEQSSDQLAYEASHDGLTGLFNRRAALDVLHRLLSPEPNDAGGRDAITTVFFVDLDHFKEVNDTLGHAAGDAVLRAVADSLRSTTRPDDMVGRIGGDEFLVATTSATSMAQATRIGERLLDAVRQSISTTNDQIGASIGIAMGSPGHEVDALLAEADVAMLDAKHRGRDGVRFFDAELRGRTIEELNLAADIRTGLSNGEFELHYQPIVDAVSGRVVHYEALIRWHRPGIGPVPPDTYIPFAEASDLVIEIDRWVLRTAVDVLSARALDGVGLAVNISGRHLANGDLYGDLLAELERLPINASELTIEITESALLGDIDGAIETLRRMRETGVKIAIDDFGTGFTSLTHLRSLPADVLKIDQTFTANLDNSDDANLIRLVIQTAHILRLDVVVEGVETLDQARRVTMLGADQMQGYLFARPMPLHELRRGPSGEPLTTNRTASRR